MADVKTVDIDGSQWSMKDQVARDKIATLEEKITKNFEYSTTEQEIGKWINGKKHYRAIVTGNTTTHNAKINLTDKNIENITKINGVFTTSSGLVFPIPYYNADSGEELGANFSYLFFSKNDNEMSINFGYASFLNDINFNIEIEYTKNN